MAEKRTEKVAELLTAHRAEVIESLGAKAFDILTPHEAAQEAGIHAKRIPDLIREGWLDYVPGKDIGRAHQYYRWRAVFVKQYRKTRSNEFSKTS